MRRASIDGQLAVAGDVAGERLLAVERRLQSGDHLQDARGVERGHAALDVAELVRQQHGWLGCCRRESEGAGAVAGGVLRCGALDVDAHARHRAGTVVIAHVATQGRLRRGGQWRRAEQCQQEEQSGFHVSSARIDSAT